MFVNRNPEYFLTIARERNFSRAAEQLFISQSSLSQHVAKLEEALGARLFDRSKNPIDLTQAGELYKSYLESSTFLYRRFQADLTQLSDASRQTVNIGFGTWRGSMLIPDILPGFLETHPQILVNLHEYPVSELLPRIRSGQVDFAVMNMSGDAMPEELVQEVIGYERILLVCRRDLPAAKMLLETGSVSSVPDALSTSRFIHLDPRLIIGKTVENYLNTRRIVPEGRLMTTNNRTLLRLAAEGLGYGFMVESGLQELPGQDRMALFDLGDQELLVPLTVLYKKGSYLSPWVQALIEDIRTYYTDLLQKNADDERILRLRD